MLLVVTVIRINSTSGEKLYEEREKEREENELSILANNRIPKGKGKSGRKNSEI